MAKIGYARVSTRSQNDDSQLDDLIAHGCDKIFTDTAPASTPRVPSSTGPWPTCARATCSSSPGCPGRWWSLKHLLALVDELRERGAGLVVLKQQIDTTTPTARLVFHVLGAID
jgi:DNA invertase Pin-like site-specific DNA recombinase